MLHPDELTPERMLDELDVALDGSFPNGGPMPLDGLQGAAAEIDELLAGATRPTPAVGV
jgi:predicted glycosyltransferase